MAQQNKMFLGDYDSQSDGYPPPPELSLPELVDGAYDIVEIWPALTPAQKIWKRKWLECARQHGAQPT